MMSALKTSVEMHEQHMLAAHRETNHSLEKTWFLFSRSLWSNCRVSGDKDSHKSLIGTQ